MYFNATRCNLREADEGIRDVEAGPKEKDFSHRRGCFQEGADDANDKAKLTLRWTLGYDFSRV